MDRLRVERVPAARVDLQAVLIDLVPEMLRALGLAVAAMIAPLGVLPPKMAGPMVRHLKPRALGAASLVEAQVLRLVGES